MPSTRLTLLAALGILGAGSAATALADGGDHRSGFRTSVHPYLSGVPGTGFTTEPLITAGDTVPVTDSPAERYEFTGIPDGLGVTTDDLRARRRRGGVITAFVNHEIAQEAQTDPYPDRPGRQQGAFVDELRLARDGSIISGRRAFDTEFQDDTQVDSADSPVRAFSRFCSASLADSRVGFDRPIFLTGEESGGRTAPDGSYSAPTFDPARGSQSVAIFTTDDGKREAHALSDLGYFPRENTVIVPNTGRETIAFITEDGPQTPISQLHMYVGEKQRHGSVLERNGLVGGKLYVFASNDPSRNSEATVDNGSVDGRWVEIPKAQRQNEAQEEQAEIAAGAFGFVRIEDGAMGGSGREFFFNTTGNSADKTINRLGANYRLEFDPGRDPAQQTPRLNVVLNSDQIDAQGQDGPFSQDNLETIGRLEFALEDGTSDSRPEMAERGRDGSVWMFDGAFTSTSPGRQPPRLRIAELEGTRAGNRFGQKVAPGFWESSGIVDARHALGGKRSGLTFLIDVQAHDTTPLNPHDTLEDGQLLILRGR